MKQTSSNSRMWLILLLVIGSLIFCLLPSHSSELYPLPNYWDFRTLASWSQPKIATGTELPAIASAAEGDLFIKMTASESPILYFRSQADGWLSFTIDLASSTFDHSTLSSLSFELSGHTGFASLGAIVEHNQQSEAHNATVLASETFVEDSISAHDSLSAAHNADTLASEAFVYETIDNLDLASETFVTEAIQFHDGLSEAHNATVLASEAFVLEEIAKLPSESVIVHAQKSDTHNSLVIASEAYVSDSIASHNSLSEAHNASVLASETFVEDSISAHDSLSAAHNANVLASEAFVDEAVSSHNNLSQAHNAETLASETFVIDTIASHAAIQKDPHGASMTLSEGLYLGEEGDARIVWKATGTAEIASYLYFPPNEDPPESPATGTFWLDASGTINYFDQIGTFTRINKASFATIGNDGNATATTLTAIGEYYLWDLASKTMSSNDLNLIATTTNSRIVVQKWGAGVYLVNLSTTYATPNNAQNYSFAVFKNGSIVSSLVANRRGGNVGNMPAGANVTGLIELVEGDTLDIRISCLTTSTVALTIQIGNLSINRIGF